MDVYSGTKFKENPSQTSLRPGHLCRWILRHHTVTCNQRFVSCYVRCIVLFRDITLISFRENMRTFEPTCWEYLFICSYLP